MKLAPIPLSAAVLYFWLRPVFRQDDEPGVGSWFADIFERLVA